jgi:hypothetical protein
MAASVLPQFTPAEWRVKSHLARAAAKNEANVPLRQALAAHALDMALLAEKIEREAAAPQRSAAVPVGHPPSPTFRPKRRQRVRI